jgi:acyl dehydratase
LADQYDPKLHRVVAPRRFADLQVGESFRSPSRTMTEAYFAAFQAISGDNHPIHYDVEYCRARGYPGLLAHGFQVLAFTAVGAGSFPHAIGDSLIGFVEQSSKFLKPVFAGDTLYPTLTISALLPQKTTGVVAMEATLHNQRAELVMTGEHKYRADSSEDRVRPVP